MLLQELITTFEELKKYVFIINRGTKKPIIIKFNNDNFYHLVGLHKTNIDMFFPNYIKSKSKKYKYMKSNVNRFNNILINQTKEKDTLEYRVKTFKNIIDLLKKNENTTLYNLNRKIPGSMYNGNYGLLKIYEEIYCLFGLKIENENMNFVYCAPQSWMASNRISRLIEGNKPIFMENITAIPVEMYNNYLDEDTEDVVAI